MRKKIIELLCNLGFCEKTADLYILLLTEGPLCINKLLLKTKLSEKEMTPLLADLIYSRLIFEDRDQFWVLHPQKSFKSYYEEKLWSVTSTPYNSLENVPSNQLDTIKQIKQNCYNLQLIASQLYKHRSPIALNKIKVARNPDQFVALLVESIDKAEEGIFCLSTSPKLPHLSIIWGSLVPKIKSGVKYVRIVDVGEIIEHGLAIVQRDIEEIGIHLYIIERKYIDRKFYMVDDKFVVMFAPDKYSAYEFTLTGQIISNKLIINSYKKTFDETFKKAIPASFVLKVINKQKFQFIEKATKFLDEAQVRWLKCLIDFGIFCKFNEFNQFQLKKATDIAMQKGLLKSHKINDNKTVLLPNYNISENQIRYLWEKENPTK